MYFLLTNHILEDIKPQYGDSPHVNAWKVANFPLTTDFTLRKRGGKIVLKAKSVCIKNDILELQEFVWDW